MKTRSVRTIFLFTAAASVLNLLLSLLFVLRLPDRVPTHFDENWVCDGYGSRWTALITAFLPLLFLPVLPVLTKKHPENAKPNAVMCLMMTVYLIGLNWMMLQVSSQDVQLGEQADALAISWLLPLLFAFMLIAVGNYMPIMQPNGTMGVRVKWTMENENCWRVTHRFAGRLWVVTGLIMTGLILTALLCKVEDRLWMLILLFEAVTVDIAAPCFYAYLHKDG